MSDEVIEAVERLRSLFWYKRRDGSDRHLEVVLDELERLQAEIMKMADPVAFEMALTKIKKDGKRIAQLEALTDPCMVDGGMSGYDRPCDGSFGGDCSRCDGVGRVAKRSADKRSADKQPATERVIIDADDGAAWVRIYTRGNSPRESGDYMHADWGLIELTMVKGSGSWEQENDDG